MKYVVYAIAVLVILIVVAVIALVGAGTYASNQRIGPGYKLRVSNHSGADVMLRIYNVSPQRKLVAERLSKASSWTQVWAVTEETDGTELVCSSGDKSVTYVLGGKMSALPAGRRHSFNDGKTTVELTISPGLEIAPTQHAGNQGSSTQPQSAPVN